MESITLIIQTYRCEANRRNSNFECYGLVSTLDFRFAGDPGVCEINSHKPTYRDSVFSVLVAPFY